MVQTAFSLLVTALIIAFVSLWIVVIRRALDGRGALPRTPRRAVPWGWIDVVTAILLLLITNAAAYWALRTVFGVPVSSGTTLALLSQRTAATVVLFESLATVATMALSMAVIRLRFRVTRRDFGLVGRLVGSDIRLGILAFVMLAPPVYALQVALVQWFPSKHPLLELLKHGPHTALIAACAFSAALVAPVVEEYLFRVLLQGWLEKLADPAGPGAGVRAEQPSIESTFSASIESESPCPGAGAPDSESLSSNPYASPRAAGEKTALDVQPARGGPPASWPIFVSSLLFAVMHAAHGPDWIPLFFLAVGLGYLYRQTHRITPCIVVHFLLNACSLGLFLFDAARQASAG